VIEGEVVEAELVEGEIMPAGEEQADESDQTRDVETSAAPAGALEEE
jgi:hypothetical protein